VGFGSGIGYKGNSLVISGTGIPVESPFPVEFGSGEKILPLRQGMGMERFSLDGDGSWEPFPTAIPNDLALSGGSTWRLTARVSPSLVWPVIVGVTWYGCVAACCDKED
jgi:hypothetical protein